MDPVKEMDTELDDENPNSDRLRTVSMADNGEHTRPQEATVTIRTTEEGHKVTTLQAFLPQKDLPPTENTKPLSYHDTVVIGNGSFGVVFKAKLYDTNETVAIKKVLQDSRYKNRELDILREVAHPHVLKLDCFFHSSGSKRDEVYLHIVTKFFPDTMASVIRRQKRAGRKIPEWLKLLLSYQLCRGLNYLHVVGICHRDIKPHNILLDTESNLLQICDFGSAKHLEPGQPSVSYICSRYYRAPELIFGNRHYSSAIDMWSAGCVMAEMCLQRPIFPGESSLDQLVEIIKRLGTPSRSELKAMTPDYDSHTFPNLVPHPWDEIIPQEYCSDSFRSFLAAIFVYDPHQRLTAMDALLHPALDPLRNEEFLDKLSTFPPLFDFSEEELSSKPGVGEALIPSFAQ
eukprot:m.83801 g.83801  ORF g.83801 m.83801 type:complete len:402 (+) comp12133_c0_seq1:2871-4076(+)